MNRWPLRKYALLQDLRRDERQMWKRKPKLTQFLKEFDVCFSCKDTRSSAQLHLRAILEHPREERRADRDPRRYTTGNLPRELGTTVHAHHALLRSSEQAALFNLKRILAIVQLAGVSTIASRPNELSGRSNYGRKRRRAFSSLIAFITWSSERPLLGNSMS